MILSTSTTLTICPREACPSDSARGFWLDPAARPVTQTPAPTGTWHRIWNIINMLQEVMPTLTMETNTFSLKETSDKRQGETKHIRPCCCGPTEETWKVRWREPLLMRKKGHILLCLVRVHFPTSSLIQTRRWRAVISPCCHVDYWCICTNFSLFPSVAVWAHRFVKGKNMWNYGNR